jgi:hypothetical protein
MASMKNGNCVRLLTRSGVVTNQPGDVILEQLQVLERPPCDLILGHDMFLLSLGTAG